MAKRSSVLLMVAYASGKRRVSRTEPSAETLAAYDTAITALFQQLRSRFGNVSKMYFEKEELENVITILRRRRQLKRVCVLYILSHLRAVRSTMAPSRWFTDPLSGRRAEDAQDARPTRSPGVDTAPA